VCHCKGVTIQFLRCSEWLLAHYYVVAWLWLQCHVAAMLGCSEWLLGCCVSLSGWHYAVAKVYPEWFLSCYYCILLLGCCWWLAGHFYALAEWLLGCCVSLSGCYYPVAKVFEWLLANYYVVAWLWLP